MPYREDIPGHMYGRDFKAIEALAACVSPHGTVVEVGAYYGRSAWAWAKSVPSSATVYCIDSWEGNKDDPLPQMDRSASLDEFKEYVKDCSNIIPIQGYSPTMTWDKNLRPDLVFIDGNHLKPHVDNDLAFWSKQLNPHGILCGHDFNPSKWPDVCAAVIQLAKSIKKPFRLFEDNTIWYFELEREEFKVENREVLMSRLLLEEISWQPTPNNILQIQSMFQM